MLNARQALRLSKPQIVEVSFDELLIVLESEVVAAAAKGKTHVTYTLPRDKFFTPQNALLIEAYLRQLDYHSVRINYGPRTYSISFKW